MLWLLAATAAAAGPLEASSPDGGWQLRADGTQLLLRDAAQTLVKTFTAAAQDGSRFSLVAAVVHAAPRRSFVVSFNTLPELWEISLDPAAEPIFPGWVHDYKMGEGLAEPGFLGLRRTRLEQPLTALAFDASHAFVLGRAPDDALGHPVLHLVQLDIRKRIAAFVLDAVPDLAAARAERRDGRDLIVVPLGGGADPATIDVRAARRL